MSSEDFDVQALGEKLLKLNNSQQSIESLSQWCVSHRKKAKQIVETWDKTFNSSQKEKCVSFLYLANDILQNSRRKGSEFVNEFWKVLPAALKHVYGNGDELGKKVVTRLVDIWDERKVFGSRGHGLKDEMLGKDPPPVSVSNGKSSNPIKIVKRDASSVRVKLAVGGLPEKILTAYQSVLDEHSTEEAALDKYSAAATQVEKIEEDADSKLNQGSQQGSALVDDLQEQEDIIKQCISQLENSEATRATLISQLRDALHEQESKLGHVRAQLQGARVQVEQASNLRKRLIAPSVLLPQGPTNSFLERPRMEQSLPSIQPMSNTTQPPLSQPAMPFSSLKTSDEDSKKAAVAAIAAKLSNSTSSAQMLSSVLSSLVAEEAASKNGGLKPASFSSALPIFPPEKRPKLEKMPVSNSGNSDLGNLSYFSPLQQQSGSNMPVATSMGMPPASQSNQMQAPFASPPPPPPLPSSLSSANLSGSQYVQSAGMNMMAGLIPYGFGASLPPPPPLPPPHISLQPLARPGLQPPQQPHVEQPQQHQQPASGGYYQPPGLGFFGQSHQSATPPVPRQ
ncbi:regulation of nuclear pre-mRNA domain-containing protein 1A [Eucalyptus grandis]|uniref:regulation of nuclear pre-mRNA domain-containing protein 1A n=1 Tax=Eucalyptus grandis TaxID=71139 RepID=UPI00192EC4BA|nr:regulation of nuclear pre-mRNA domain-containing protein 1A [Eucalyptus grandis]